MFSSAATYMVSQISSGGKGHGIDDDNDVNELFDLHHYCYERWRIANLLIAVRSYTFGSMRTSSVVLEPV